MARSKVEVVAIGNVIKETIIREKKIIGPVLGSPCAYTSVALALAGIRTGMISYYGEDFKGEIETELRLVDLEGIQPYLHTTENHLLYFDGESNRVEYSKVCPVITYDMIPESYRESHTFFICPMNFEVDLKLCRTLYEEGKYLVTDLGGFGGTTSYNHFSIDSKRGRYLIEQLCRYSAIIKASFDDLQYLMPGQSVEDCMDCFLQMGAEKVFVTLGPKGAAYREKGKESRHIDAIQHEREDQLNLTGAGDVFTAGVIAALLGRPEEMDYAMAYGNCAASLVLEESGGCEEQRMPTDRMIRMRMEGRL